MKAFLKGLNVDNLIVHDVPKKFSRRFVKENPEAQQDGPILSDAPSTVDIDLIRFFHNKISSTIGSSSAFEIELDPALSDNKTQQSILNFFKTGKTTFPLPENELIEITQDIAKMLHEVQTAVNPGGILLFIPCHNQNKFGIAVLKVEREDGVRIQRGITEHGKTTFNAQHIKDLMLTKTTRLFKIVLFFWDNGGIVGFLCDQQQGVLKNREVANFFLTNFLGCKLKEEPHVSTKRFFEITTSYINNSDLTDSEKIDLRTHLVSELSNNLPAVNVYNFSQRYLPDGKTQCFMETMKKGDVPDNFSKDIQLIKESIRKIKYELESGIKITGTEEAIKRNLTIESRDDGKTKFELIDRLKKVE
jgi:hypothetical protein